MDSPQTEPSSRIEAERDEDSRVDQRSILAIFVVLVLGAIHFVSGWTFDF